jgi:hypothetical protein
MTYTKHHTGYSCTINGKYYRTGLDNFEGLLAFISQCNEDEEWPEDNESDVHQPKK